MKKLFSIFFAAQIFNLALLHAQQVEEPNDNPAIDDSATEIQIEDDSEIDSSIQREFVISMGKQNWNLDPHRATYTSEAQLLESLYEGLFSYDPRTLEPIPAIAKSYKISRDKKKWTFEIRENVFFSDGDAITAFTVRNAWIDLLKTPDAPYASLLDCIKGAEGFRKGTSTEEELGIIARDNKTLVVQLKAPTAHLNRILCHHAFSVCMNNDSGSPAQKFSGAFIIQEQSPEKISLLKNEKYWDASNVHLPKITINLSDNLSDNSWNYNTGATDWISGMFDTSSILNGKTIRISAIFGTEYLFFNCRNKPWNNAAFRNALMAAVPWAELRQNSLVKATTFVYPLAGYPAVEGLSETSLEDAKEMMEEARKSAGIPKDEKITLTFGISTSSSRMKAHAEVLKRAWEPLGVELKIQTTPEERYIDSISGWNADIFSYSWIGDFADPLAFLELFREGSTLNVTQWKNEKFSKLIEDAALTTNTSEHYSLLSQAEQILLDDGVVLPISHSICLHAINLQNIGGWYINALDIHPYKYLYFKDVSTETAPNII